VRRVKDAENFPLIILGNKCDMECDRKVTLEEGQALAAELKVTFMETSAKLPKNVDEAFHTIVREMNKFREKNPPPPDKVKKRTGCVLL
jgi:GTPase KRas